MNKKEKMACTCQQEILKITLLSFEHFRKELKAEQGSISQDIQREPYERGHIQGRIDSLSFAMGVIKEKINRINGAGNSEALAAEALNE